jgi:hypothetical protein
MNIFCHKKNEQELANLKSHEKANLFVTSFTLLQSPQSYVLEYAMSQPRNI